jgi:hypothetical protein
VPFKKLVVELGGLCMLVIRKTGPEDQRGLYVLMPDGHHMQEQHCPLFVAESKHTASGKVEFERLEHDEQSDEVDLRFMAPHSANPTRLPTFVANVSRFYKVERKVNANCFAGGKQHGLGARIILPLPATITQVGNEPAVFFVPTSTTGTFKRELLAGQCEITYDVQLSRDWNNRVKGVELKPDGADTIKMYFVNARPKDLSGASYEHQEGEPWQHPQSYHDLLEKGDSMKGPRAIFGKDQQGDEDKPKKEDCRSIRIAVWPPEIMKFIDPYTCTLGGGCPPGESC